MTSLRRVSPKMPGAHDQRRPGQRPAVGPLAKHHGGQDQRADQPRIAKRRDCRDLPGPHGRGQRVIAGDAEDVVARQQPGRAAGSGQCAPPVQARISAPATASMAKPRAPSWRFVSAFGAARVARSRPAKPSMPATASSDSAENPVGPRPQDHQHARQSPEATASQRAAPTFSPNISAAPAITTNGVACRMADALDSGVSATASA